MTSATQELRRLLDERGVKYDERFGVTEFNGEGGSVVVACESVNEDGVLYVVSHLTPKQVIAAALGRGNCEMEYAERPTNSTLDAIGVYFCSECGSPIYNDCMPRYCIYCGSEVTL